MCLGFTYFARDQKYSWWASLTLQETQRVHDGLHLLCKRPKESCVWASLTMQETRSIHNGLHLLCKRPKERCVWASSTLQETWSIHNGLYLLCKRPKVLRFRASLTLQETQSIHNGFHLPCKYPKYSCWTSFTLQETWSTHDGLHLLCKRPKVSCFWASLTLQETQGIYYGLRLLSKRPKVSCDRALLTLQETQSIHNGLHLPCKRPEVFMMDFIYFARDFFAFSKIFYWPFQGGTSFEDHLCFSVLCLLCPCVRLFICALWLHAGKGLTSWLSFVVSNREFVTFLLVSWVRCGTWLYRFLIFAPLLTFKVFMMIITYFARDPKYSWWASLTLQETRIIHDGLHLLCKRPEVFISWTIKKLNLSLIFTLNYKI